MMASQLQPAIDPTPMCEVTEAPVHVPPSFPKPT